MRNSLKRGLLAGAFAGVFATGYLCGSVTQRNADAQMGDLGGAAMKAAEGQGGAVGSAAKLGSAITDMESHVSALQKNLDTLKGIKSALGG